MLVGEAGFAESGAVGHREGRRGNEGLGGRHAGYSSREEDIAYVYVTRDSLSSRIVFKGYSLRMSGR